MFCRYISLTLLLALPALVSCDYGQLIHTSPQEPLFSFKDLLGLQKSFWDHFMYPADAKEAKSINSTILSQDVLGRIDITRTFNGRELNTEYLFGLFANLAATPESFTLLGIPKSYEILHFTANQNIAAASTRVQFQFPSLNTTIPIIIDSWNTWNSQKQISQYDIIFKWWPHLVEYALQQAVPLLGVSSTDQAVAKITQALAESICTTEQTYCKGKNQQYASKEECVGFLTKKIPFGPIYSLGQNNLLCRMVHQNMVPFRPEVHCPHIGKTGGGYCTDDITYLGRVNANYFVNSPYVPFGAE